MDAAVGTTNPVKVAAAERALDGTARVRPVEVDPGVPEQPRGIGPTVEGAENRARRALAATDADLGIGIEGGVATYDPAPGTYLVMWAAVSDGTRTERAGGPSIPLPEDVAARVREGAELGPVVDEVVGREGVKREEGAAGVFTGGHTDRESALAVTVAGALGPFVTDHF